MRNGCDIVSQIVSDLLLSGGIVVVMLRSKNISHITKYKKWVITGEPPNYTNLYRTCDIFLYQPRRFSSRFSLGLKVVVACDHRDGVRLNTAVTWLDFQWRLVFNFESSRSDTLPWLIFNSTLGLEAAVNLGFLRSPSCTIQMPSSNNPLSTITNYNWQVAPLTRCHEVSGCLALGTQLLSS